jgi:hypothetical protein
MGKHFETGMVDGTACDRGRDRDRDRRIVGGVCVAPIRREPASVRESMSVPPVSTPSTTA